MVINSWIVIIGILCLSVILAMLVLLRCDVGDNEYIEPNEFMTDRDCLDLYNDGKRIVVDNGYVSKIVNEDKIQDVNNTIKGDNKNERFK